MIFVVENNKEYVLDIGAQGYEGGGIAKIDSYPIFISGALTGEKVRVKIIKVKKNKTIELNNIINQVFICHLT